MKGIHKTFKVEADTLAEGSKRRISESFGAENDFQIIMQISEITTDCINGLGCPSNAITCK